MIICLSIIVLMLIYYPIFFTGMGSETNSPAKPMNHTNKAIRLTFSYEGDNLRLLSKQNIDKLVFFDPELNIENRSGFFYQLVDSNNKSILKGVIPTPIVPDREIFSDQPNESIIRKPVPEMRGTFSVLVPDISEAESLDILGTPITREKTLDFRSPAK